MKLPETLASCVKAYILPVYTTPFRITIIPIKTPRDPAKPPFPYHSVQLSYKALKSDKTADKAKPIPP